MLKSLFRLKGFVGPYRWRLGFGIAFFGVARFLELSIPLSMAQAIDRIAAGNYDVTGPVALIFAAVAGRFVVVSMARYLVRSAGIRVAFDLRQALYDALQQQGSSFFNRYTIGDMMTRAVADIALIQRLIAMGTILLVIVVYASIMGFGFMFYLSPSLTLLLLPPLPFVYLYARWASGKMAVASKDVQERMSDLADQVQENLSGIRTIQAMVQEQNEIGRFLDANQAYSNAFYAQARINSLMSAWMPTIAAVCSITIIGYGGHLVTTGEMTIGVLVAFISYVGFVVQPFRVAGFVISLFQRAAVASDRLFEVLSRSPEITDAPTGEAPAQIRGDLEIRDLSFSYPNQATQALDGITLNVRAGERISIMGRVGSGKTTLLKQLVRLLDTPKGVVFLDGVDVTAYPLSQLRSQVALVPQDPFLFGEALSANLTYDDPNRMLDEIWAAATSADLRETIEDFPEQMDTIVGERGVTLSGGQKQRATLARGLIRHAPVLILDDCFSSVDTETEEHILAELARLRRGQTTLLVSHRVSTARHSDRIVMLDAGRIVEEGTHEELIASGGLYAELERIQREGASEADYDFIGATS